MHYKVIWTDRALTKIEEVIEYIAGSSKANAKAWVDSIFDQEKNLCDFPKIGRKVPYQTDENLRELIVGNYSLFYEIVNKEIQILSLYRCSELENYSAIKN